MNLFARIWLLIWKNFKIKFRHPIVLLMEIGMPCLLSVILVVIRVVVTFDRISNSTIYSPMKIDSLYSIESKTILYTPNLTHIDSIMQTFRDTAKVNLNVQGFENEHIMVNHYLNDTSEQIACAVVFAEDQLNATKLQARIRFPFVPKSNMAGFDVKKINQFTWQTNRLFPMFREPGPRSRKVNEGGSPNYFGEGFLSVQHHLAESIAIERNATVADQLNSMRFQMQRFPYPPYNDDKFLFLLQFFFPLIFMLSFIYPSVNLTKNIVLEKENRLKEAMRMMGLQDWLHWTTWFINSFIWYMLSVSIITFLLCVPFKSELAILSNSDPSLILLFFVIYTVSSISFCFFLSTLFSKANIAGVIAGAAYFATFMPYFQVNTNYHELSLHTKIGISLIFNTNMALGCLLISMWESEHVGLQWHNLMDTASPDDNMTFFYVMLMFAIDSIIYFLLAIYIQNVFPGQYGLPQKWYFFVNPHYWKSSVSSSFSEDIVEMNEKIPKLQSENENVMVCINNLHKSYDKGKTYAVKSLNLELRQNEITVLLGHNGAGKTTLMSILCGLIPLTSGSVRVNNFDLMQDMSQIRKQLGICPQFDVLFDHLTVEEHLWFYCKLKDVDNDRIQMEIDKMISLLDLESKRHNLSYTLSGGMKRKLSLGIALAGGSRFVLLDEATSGMDVSSRRFIWDLLIKEKKNRTILLSTHFMEEADVLGDKIAIVENGSLKCFGSPMELKKQFGLGYLLTVAVREDKTNIQVLNDLVCSYVNSAKLLTAVGTEVTYSLPTSETNKFEKLFLTIEQNLEKLGVVTYGISVTTIEEVFLIVGDFAKQAIKQFNQLQQAHQDDKNGNNNNGDIEENISNTILDRFRPDSLEFNYGLVRVFQIYLSLIKKKFIFFIRNPFLMFAQFPLPSLLLMAAILTNRRQMNKATNSPALSLSLNKYKNLYISSFADNTSSQALKLSSFYQNLVEQYSNTQFNQMNYDDNQTETNSIDYLLEYGKNHEAKYNLYYMMAARFEAIEQQTVVTGLFNNQAYHSSASSIALLDNVLLRYLFNDSQINFEVWNEPLPRRFRDTLDTREFDSTLQVQLANNILFSTSFLLASFVIFLVKEKSSNFKHIQQISGLHLFQYWSSNFVIDFSFYLVSVMIMSAVIYLLKVDAFQTVTQLSYLMLTFATAGLANIPFVYVFSFLFTDSATAYVRVSLYMIIAGATTFLTVLIMEIPDFDLIHVSKILDTVFSNILPIYTLSFSVMSIYENFKAQEFCLANIPQFNINIQDICKVNISDVPSSFLPFMVCCKDKCEKDCFNFEENYFSWNKPGIGQYLVAFVGLAFFYFALLALFEYSKLTFQSFGFKSFFSTSSNQQLVEEIQCDEDVKKEEERIRQKMLTNSTKTDAMMVQNLTKRYGNFTAVNKISFGVKKSECFGILGVNGAGKTTTFKMITSDVKITEGDILINGINVKKNMKQVYCHVGYCPQFDGLLDQLTGRETLRIISVVRGIKKALIDKQIDALAQLLYFSKHIDKRVSSYSGGTKRKLSFAISIIGNPLITFLDEPTTGVDPVSRRCLWNAIQLVRMMGSSVAITSHSMEECEALCNRLFIMVNAKIACIGSPLHLKQKYGTGYIVQVKLSSNLKLSEQNKAFHKLKNHLTQHYPACRLESSYSSLCTFRIETNKVKLSTLFGDIEKLKQSSQIPIEDYSICQASLESIFLSFARKQRELNVI